VAVVGEAFLGAGEREGLAGAGSGPDFPFSRPAGAVEGEIPAADAGEEMTRGETLEVRRADVGNGSFVDFAMVDKPLLHEIAQPRGGERIVLVVIGGHAFNTDWRRLR
jgi:hypothetical protein